MERAAAWAEAPGVAAYGEGAPRCIGFMSRRHDAGLADGLEGTVPGGLLVNESERERECCASCYKGATRL